MSPKPIDFRVIPRVVVEDITKGNPIPREFLNNYLQTRPGILDDGHCDIFQHNIRTDAQRWEAFSLFEERNVARMIVFPFWLELFQAAGCPENIQICIDWLRSLYTNVAVIVQWNHDIPSEHIPALQNLPENFFVLNYNTARPTPNDILLPFWAINTNPPFQDMKPIYKMGFCGYGGTDLRRALRADVEQSPLAVYWSEDRVDENEYFRRMSQCQFSLCPRGGGLSSYRLYESIMMKRPPVIFGDDAALPYPWLSWDAFTVRVSEKQVGTGNWFERLDYYEKRALHLLGVHRYFTLWGVHHEIYNRITRFLK